MNNFSQTIADWQPFYLLAGTAAVTLIGLLFVAISLNIELFRQKASTDLQHFAALTFNCFFYVLMIAMLFHIPNISNLGLGIPMSLLGALSLINAIIQKSRARKNQKSHLESDIAARFNIPIAGLLLWFILSIGIIFQWTISLYGLVVVVILLLGSASQNAWALLVEIKR